MAERSTMPRRAREERAELTIYPQLDYAIATEQRRLPPERNGVALNGIPILVELSATGLKRFDPEQPLLQAFLSKKWLAQDLRDSVQIPDVFASLSIIVKGDLLYCVVLIELRHLALVRQDPGWNQVILSAEVGPPVQWKKFKGGVAGSHDAALAAKPLQRVSQAQALGGQIVPPPPSGVVIAVLDEGIAFAHERFRTAAGSRIAYFWNQDGSARPAPFGSFGSELTANDIGDALKEAAKHGLGDESSVYRAIGDLDFSQDRHQAVAHRRSHGTHVLDLAAALDNPDPLGNPYPPDSRPIIAVQLPERAIADSSGTRLTPFMLLGIIYILLRAHTLPKQGQPQPIVVNLSYGMYAGPHDGSHVFERVVDWLVEHSSTPLYVVVAAGNHRLARARAAFTIAPTLEKTLHWRIQPDDRTPSILEIWLSRPGDEVEVTIEPPSSTVQPITITKGTTKVISGPSGYIYGAFYVASNGATRPYISITVEPTAPALPLDANEPTAPAGLWKVRVKNTSATQLEINAYIQRDDTIYGRKSMGRQSYFDDPGYARHDTQGEPLEFDPDANSSYVLRRGTLNALATGKHTYVIGGYRRTDRMPARYSSMGPAHPGARTTNAPNWLAPSDDSPVCHGILAAGTCSGSRVMMNGTSVAAPQAARFLAHWLAQGRLPVIGPPPEVVPPPASVQPPDRGDVYGDGCLIVPGRNEDGDGPLLLPGRNARP